MVRFRRMVVRLNIFWFGSSKDHIPEIPITIKLLLLLCDPIF
jgi:hypothetical protein